MWASVALCLLGALKLVALLLCAQARPPALHGRSRISPFSIEWAASPADTHTRPRAARQAHKEQGSGRPSAHVMCAPSAQPACTAPGVVRRTKRARQRHGLARFPACFCGLLHLADAWARRRSGPGEGAGRGQTHQTPPGFFSQNFNERSRNVQCTGRVTRLKANPAGRHR
jgi:hypothetical protein